MISTRADRCCFVLYSTQSRGRAWEHWGQRAIAQQSGTKDAFTQSQKQSEMEDAFEKKKLDPIAGSPATGKSVAGIINLFVGDLFGTGGNEMEQRVLTNQTFKISKLVQKMGTMLPLQDREFAGHKIPYTGRTLKSVKARPLMSWKKSQWNETRRKTSIALLQCRHCTEAYWDRYIGYRVGVKEFQ